GGFDVSLTRRVSLRTQGDYFLTRLSTGSITALNGYENRFRIVGGIVFNFGGTDPWRARRPRRPHVDAVVSQPQPAAVADVAPMPLAPAPNSVRPAAVSTPAAAAYTATAPKPAQVAPKPAQVVPPAQIPASARVVPSTQKLNSQIANRPAPVQQEESLGEVARRYRAQRKKQLEQSH